ncbi:hypothetical protein ACJX0J_017694, partial [Zea mays]
LAAIIPITTITLEIDHGNEEECYLVERMDAKAKWENDMQNTATYGRSTATCLVETFQWITSGWMIGSYLYIFVSIKNATIPVYTPFRLLSRKLLPHVTRGWIYPVTS